jgi:hypothetical protein
VVTLKKSAEVVVETAHVYDFAGATKRFFFEISRPEEVSFRASQLNFEAEILSGRYAGKTLTLDLYGSFDLREDNYLVDQWIARIEGRAQFGMEYTQPVPALNLFDVLPSVFDAGIIYFGNAFRNHLSGGDGADRLFGGDGDDVLKGQAGRDRLLGGFGKDSLLGGSARDVLRGEDGDDTLIGGDGADLLVGGPGYDLFRFSDIRHTPADRGDVIADFVISQLLGQAQRAAGESNRWDLGRLAPNY